MVVKKNPLSLQALSLQSLCQALLQQWKNTYYTNYLGYSESFIHEMSALIPPSFNDRVFDIMVDTHARFIQKEYTYIPSISALVNSIISPKLSKLNLHCLRHIGIIPEEEIQFLEVMLVSKLPYLDNLVEINLQTSMKDFTLPICTDNILKEIGSTCFMLNCLDVSHNHSVTDEGLQSLVPSKNRKGCPKLVKVSLFECSVTHEGVLLLIEGLPKLKFLGYRETVQSLRILYNHMKLHSKVKSYPKLQLAHINNLGLSNRTCKNYYTLECDNIILNHISKLCPKLNGLKLRVKDSSLKDLNEITTATILELVYNLGTPSSPGNNTFQYLQLCGAKFIHLSLVCDTVTIHCLKVICEECNNLKHLNLSSNKFISDIDIAISDKKKCVLTNLEEFQFKTGYDSLSDLCNIPSNIFNYVLHKSQVLTNVILTMRNSLLTDSYIEDLFFSIETSKLKKVCIQLPYDKNVILSPVSLTMVSVEALFGMCPELEHLGNLLVWDVSQEDIELFRRHLQLTNSALIIS